MLTGLRFSDRFDILLKIITMRINNRERSFIHSKKGKKKKKEARVRLFPSTISTLFSFFFSRYTKIIHARFYELFEATAYCQTSWTAVDNRDESFVNTEAPVKTRRYRQFLFLFVDSFSIFFLNDVWMSDIRKEKGRKCEGPWKKKRSSKKLYSFVKR